MTSVFIMREATIATAVGIFQCSVFTPDGMINPAVVEIKSFTVEPKLPMGMSVAATWVFLVKLHPASSLEHISVCCIWQDAPPVLGSPESGECLDAQSWVKNDHIVVLGTEDFASLSARLSESRLIEKNHPIRYTRDGFEIVLPLVPAGQLTSLHFVVAINRYPESHDCSAWFAVDIPHRDVLATAD